MGERGGAVTSASCVELLQRVTQMKKQQMERRHDKQQTCKGERRRDATHARSNERGEKAKNETKKG